MINLFSSIKIGDLDLPNRVFMAPLTRCRAVGAGRVPNDLMVEYYTQRASAGLILTEATSITPMGVGYPNTPGIWSEEQVEGWKRVTDSVHRAGGHIFLQLWHVGRISHQFYLNGAQPVSSSNLPAAGHVRLFDKSEPYPVPRSLELSEIPGVIETYRMSAENALKAGFDGVNLHGGNGYLLDQFLQDSCNKREDEYGGSIENRARLMLEATDAAISVWGKDRVSMHIAPRGDAQIAPDSNLRATFTYVAKELGKRQIAFISAREYVDASKGLMASYGVTPAPTDRLGPELKAAFGGIYVANEGFDKSLGETVLAAGEADAVAFGRPFLANPDLPKRYQLNTTLNTPDPNTFYTPDAKGYTDYPAME